MENNEGKPALHPCTWPPGADVWYELPEDRNTSIYKTQTKERISNLRSYQSTGRVASSNHSVDYIDISTHNITPTRMVSPYTQHIDTQHRPH